jgi:hypothetical protein
VLRLASSPAGEKGQRRRFFAQLDSVQDSGVLWTKVLIFILVQDGYKSVCPPESGSRTPLSVFTDPKKMAKKK